MGSFGEAVVVTGFGPFSRYLVNPSWTAAQSLKAEGLEEDIAIYIKEIPVSYSSAKQILTEIWDKVQPEFAIHLGIAPGSKGITLEQTGKNYGYEARDVCGQCPLSQCCVEGGVDKLDSIIDMRSLTKKLKAKGLDVIYSKDAGRYLCDFTYYCSLQCGRGRAAFIHVPASGSVAAPEKLVPQLRSIIQAMLREIRGLSDDNTADCTMDQLVPEECSQQLTQHFHTPPL